MASVLNDVMLQKLLCSRCEKYLSVLPIKVYPKGIIKCGRCCAEGDDGRESIYNSVAKNCIFKCVNRYERCNKLLAVSEVTEHEKKCVSGTYHCPKCEYTFSGSAFELVLHYVKKHSKSIIKNGSFSVNIKQDFIKKYMYLIKDNLFFILVENVAKDKVLYMSAVSLIRHKNVTQWFSVKPTHSRATTTCKKPCYEMERFQCDFIDVGTHSMNNKVSCRVYLDLSEDVNSVSQISLIQQPKVTNKTIITASVCTQTVCVKHVLGVKFSDEFMKEYPGYDLTPCGTALFKDSLRIELTCSNCKQLTGCNVFNCHLHKHIVCWDCKSWCGICNTAINGWNVRVANINELLLLPCRWQCGKHFSGNYLSQHELSCEKSNFKCLMCTSGHMSLEQISSHLVAGHGNYKNATQFNLTGYLKECKEQAKGIVHFFQNGHWFTLRWNKKGNVYEGTIVCSTKIQFYELAVITHSGKKYNKIDSSSFEFILSDNPKFYLKRIRNLLKL